MPDTCARRLCFGRRGPPPGIDRCSDCSGWRRRLQPHWRLRPARRPIGVRCFPVLWGRHRQGARMPG
eukprot:1314123-Heterocapsa_arctica.AAC.1